MDQSQDQKQGILIIQYKLESMELGGQLVPQIDKFIHPFSSKQSTIGVFTSTFYTIEDTNG
jgi:hypothetical protein